MKGYKVNQRVGNSGGEFEGGSVVNGNPYEVLDRAYAQFDPSGLRDGAHLTTLMNDADNPICIAMTQEEFDQIVEDGLEKRHRDLRKFGSKLNEGSLVVLEPCGSDLNTAKSNKEYLPDLAASGKPFPSIEDQRIWPDYYGKSGDQVVTITPAPDHYDLIVSALKDIGN